MTWATKYIWRKAIVMWAADYLGGHVQGTAAIVEAVILRERARILEKSTVANRV